LINSLTPLAAFCLIIVSSLIAHAQTPPRVIATSPANGSTGVDPNKTVEVSFTFDQDMNGHSTTNAGKKPPQKHSGQAPYWSDSRTYVCPVNLRPGQHGDSDLVILRAAEGAFFA
jgi:hypothetical protein